MTQAIRALKAAKAEFELFTYDFTPHGGTAQCADELGVDHHAVIKTIILEDETRKPFVCLMHGDREISTKNLARVRGVKTVQPCEPETADRHSGYHVGGPSPFGEIRRYQTDNLFACCNSVLECCADFEFQNLLGGNFYSLAVSGVSGGCGFAL